MKRLIYILFTFATSICYSQQISHVSTNIGGGSFQNSTNGLNCTIGGLVVESVGNSNISLGIGSFSECDLGAPCTGTSIPTYLSSNVISLFSDNYNDVNVDTWLGQGSIATNNDIVLDGNNVKVYENLTTIVIECTGANLINAVGMTYLHIDFWTVDVTTFKVNIFDFGADELEGEGDAEMEFLCNNIPVCQWNSFLVPVSDFIALNPVSNIGKFIITGIPPGGSIYFDNIYFCNE